MSATSSGEGSFVANLIVLACGSDLDALRTVVADLKHDTIDTRPGIESTTAQAAVNRRSGGTIPPRDDSVAVWAAVAVGPYDMGDRHIDRMTGALSRVELFNAGLDARRDGMEMAVELREVDRECGHPGKEDGERVEIETHSAPSEPQRLDYRRARTDERIEYRSPGDVYAPMYSRTTLWGLRAHHLWRRYI
jgi:hypothetical protein